MQKSINDKNKISDLIGGPILKHGTNKIEDNKNKINTMELNFRLFF
jgi:hypothetical protein